jgi:NTP pyrophosphatase (non-canonical NTP hydrolase)
MKRVINDNAVNNDQSNQVIDELSDLFIVCLMFCRAFDLDIDSAMKGVISKNQVGKGRISSKTC